MSWFRRYIEKRYEELKEDNDVVTILEMLKDEAKTFIDEEGIDGIDRKAWEIENKDTEVGAYDDFITAIKQYTDLKEEELGITVFENSMQFTTPDGDRYEIDTKEAYGLRILEAIEHYDNDYLFTETYSSIWEEVYNSDGIAKEKFIPAFLRKWEIYWHKEKERLNPKVYARRKEELWRQFTAFMHCFDGGTLIELTDGLDEMVMTP